MNRKTLAAIAAATFALAGTALVSTPASAGTCRDAWITQAITEVTHRQPNGSYESGECTYTQYGGGHWNSYAELKGYVQQRLGSGPALAAGASYRPGASYSGGSGGGAAGIVAQGGGNIVAQGGGNYTH